MSLREFLNQHSAVVTLLAIVLLVAALGYGIWTTGGLRRGGEIASGLWFYEIESGKIFTTEHGTRPPIKGPSGGEGVRAHVYTCQESCSADKLDGLTAEEIEKLGFFLGFIERITPEGHDMIKKINESDVSSDNKAMQIDTAVRRYGQIRLLDSADSPWIDNDMDTVKLLNDYLASRCEGKRPKYCSPQ